MISWSIISYTTIFSHYYPKRKCWSCCVTAGNELFSYNQFPPVSVISVISVISENGKSFSSINIMFSFILKMIKPMRRHEMKTKCQDSVINIKEVIQGALENNKKPCFHAGSRPTPFLLSHKLCYVNDWTNWKVNVSVPAVTTLTETHWFMCGNYQSETNCVFFWALMEKSWTCMSPFSY